MSGCKLSLTEDAQARAHKEHKGILDAAKDKNVKMAAALLSDHINHVKSELLSSIDSKAET